jgi:hypothetical protein
MRCDGGVLEQKTCVPRPCWPTRTSARANTPGEFEPLEIANQDHHTCGDSFASQMQHEEVCKVYCDAGFLPADADPVANKPGGKMVCEYGELTLMTCEATQCGPGLEPSADGTSCARCRPNYYSPAGKACKHCPLNSKPSADSSYCRCAVCYYFDHWTPGLSTCKAGGSSKACANEACKKCVDKTLCRTLEKECVNATLCGTLTDTQIELTLVEGNGAEASKKAPGFWIHADSMSALHCLPGNCVSCDDAAGKDLIQHPLLPQGYVDLLGRGDAMKQNRANNESSTRGPPPDTTCDDGAKGCLAWQRQVIGTCCRRGHHGLLCAHCNDGWVKAKGICRPCQSFDYPRLFLLMIFYGGVATYFWFKASKIKEARDVDQKCQSAGLSISTFFLQTAALLEIDTGVDVNIGVLNIEVDSSTASDARFEGSCLSSGNFYADWAIRFSIPLMMVAVTLVACLVARSKTHQMWRALLMVLRFGLFPYTLNALLVFFCRTEPVLAQPDILRSDPSIVCWDSAHWLLVAVGATAFVLCGIVTPVVLLLALKRTIASQAVITSRDGAAAEELTAEEKMGYTRAFERYDANGSGHIDPAEMLQLLKDHTQKGSQPVEVRSWLRKQWDRLLGTKPMSEQSANEMRGWMGLTADDDIAIDDFMRAMVRLKRERTTSVHDQQHAVTDALSMLYYPFKAECYWWSILLLLRPTVIAIAYNARNRESGIVLGLVDWRVLVIVTLVGYSNLQAAHQPFKLVHESTLDNLSVTLLVLLYSAHIGRDQIIAGGLANTDIFLIMVLVSSSLTLVMVTIRGRYITRRLIRQSIVKHLGTSILAAEEDDSDDNLAVACTDEANARATTPIRRREGHTVTPPQLDTRSNIQQTRSGTPSRGKPPALPPSQASPLPLRRFSSMPEPRSTTPKRGQPATAGDWISKVDPASGHVYYVNAATKKSQWYPPSDGVDPGNITPDSFEHVFSGSTADSGPRP